MKVGDKVSYIGGLASLKGKTGTIVALPEFVGTDYGIVWDNWDEGHNSPANIAYDPAYNNSCWDTHPTELALATLTSVLKLELS